MGMMVLKQPIEVLGVWGDLGVLLWGSVRSAMTGQCDGFLRRSLGPVQLLVQVPRLLRSLGAL